MTSSTRHSAVLITAYIANSALNYAFGVVLSWLITPAQFGVLGVAQSLLLLMALAVGSGFAWTANQDVASQGVNDSTRQRVRSALVLNVLLGFFVSLAVWIAYRLGWLSFGPAYLAIIPLVGLTTSVLAARAVLNGVARGLLQFTPVAVNLVGEVVIKIAASLLLVYLGAGPAGVMAGFAIGATASLLHSLWIVRPARLWQGQGLYLRQVLRATAPLFIGMAGTALMLNLDVLGLKFFSPASQGDELAGYYQAAVILARTPVFIAQALTLVFFSYAAGASRKAAAERGAVGVSPDHLAAALNAWGRMLLPAGLVFIIAPRAVLLLLFPPVYLSAAFALQIAAVGGVLLALVTLLNGLFQASGEQPRSALACGSGALVQLSILYLFVPKYGVPAAGLSLVAGSLVALIVLSPAVRQLVVHSIPFAGIQKSIARLALPLLALSAPLALIPDHTRTLSLVQLLLAGIAYLSLLQALHWRPDQAAGRQPIRIIGHFINVLIGS